MLRSARLEPVRKVAADAERCSVEALVAAQTNLTALQQKLAELERYEQEYRAALQARTLAGIDVVQLRSFHNFISRLGDAITQQGALIARAQDEVASARQRWLEASQRTRVVSTVIDNASADEKRVLERLEQTAADERSQHAKPMAVAYSARQDTDDDCEE